MEKQTKKPRVYRRITPKTVSDFKAKEIEHGNGSSAIRDIYPEAKNKGDRAFRIRKKSETETTEQFIDTQLQQIGIDAVNRLGELVQSPNEQIASKNVQYAIDHIRGQATKKSVSITAKLNIQNVLD